MQENVNVVPVNMAHYFWNAFMNLIRKRQHKRGQGARDFVLRRVALT